MPSSKALESAALANAAGAVSSAAVVGRLFVLLLVVSDAAVLSLSAFGVSGSAEGCATDSAGADVLSDSAGVEVLTDSSAAVSSAAVLSLTASGVEVLSAPVCSAVLCACGEEVLSETLCVCAA